MTAYYEVVWLSRTQAGRGLQLRFKVVGQLVAEGGVSAFSVVAGDEVAGFKLALARPGK